MYDFGDGYKAIAPPREMLPMDPGSERAIVSTPIDSRREVALQVLRVSVEKAQRRHYLGNRRQLADFCGLAAGQEDSLLDVSRL